MISVPPVHPLAAIAAQMRQGLQQQSPTRDPVFGDYHCAQCGAHLLQNTQTWRWESEEDLALCPAFKKPSWHKPSLWKKPEPEVGEDDE